MGEYDLVSELCDICVTLLRVVDAQESALAQLGAVTDAEGAVEAKSRLTALQGRLRPGFTPPMNGGSEL
ncbi:MAG: hypothetical protein EOM58_01060 [Clostridia bacterium]|nr:hypothetical protein [Clostridia bacterium]